MFTFEELYSSIYQPYKEDYTMSNDKMNGTGSVSKLALLRQQKPKPTEVDFAKAFDVFAA